MTLSEYLQIMSIIVLPSAFFVIAIYIKLTVITSKIITIEESYKKLLANHTQLLKDLNEVNLKVEVVRNIHDLKTQHKKGI